MAESDKLNVDNIIAQLLEGQFSDFLICLFFGLLSSYLSYLNQYGTGIGLFYLLGYISILYFINCLFTVAKHFK